MSLVSISCRNYSAVGIATRIIINIDFITAITIIAYFVSALIAVIIIDANAVDFFHYSLKWSCKPLYIFIREKPLSSIQKRWF